MPRRTASLSSIAMSRGASDATSPRSPHGPECPPHRLSARVIVRAGRRIGRNLRPLAHFNPNSPCTLREPQRGGRGSGDIFKAHSTLLRRLSRDSANRWRFPPNSTRPPSLSQAGSAGSSGENLKETAVLTDPTQSNVLSRWYVPELVRMTGSKSPQGRAFCPGRGHVHEGCRRIDGQGSIAASRSVPGGCGGPGGPPAPVMGPSWPLHGPPRARQFPRGE